MYIIHALLLKCSELSISNRAINLFQNKKEAKPSYQVLRVSR